ncbi:MAG: cation:proton antiporter [Devosia sp.]|uniref:monovalent cation:proton antiporter-2 (CPA2) family protein n=1 Tax=Devosia sp. 66-22 TaxID=1895753 RepID=UPI00092C4ABD|nr:monovalent cation:proton antiporter-2 (CPA2) family protein [Devosia sp. 66-22]MBN9347121.1 cation:proton antiporter [Devosia sp.]OJX50592.1 MAG: potassium transporter [Devosia sp. 66-22]
MDHAVEQAAEHAASGIELWQVLALLAAGVIAVPIFKRAGLGSVLGYLAAGLAIGPFGLRLIADPESILHVSELGVVLFLFIVGLEMEPSRLWNLRKQIFGLGILQVGICGALLTGVGVLLGLSPAVAFVAGMGFVLTSTAIVMQILTERGDLASPAGQKIVSILLLEDLAIVPLLAVVALLAPQSAGEAVSTPVWISILIAVGCIAALNLIGRWVLNPMFRFLADARAREVMTAAALLVVLGAALLFQFGGLSMAMGAFLAGVLLSTSTFRHQLEADVEPFRGILLGLFFLAVGMSLDLNVVWANWQTIAIMVAAYMVVKGGAIFILARLLKSKVADALERALLMAQGGEFAFVLFTTAAASGLITGEQQDMFSATVIISMVLTPLTMLALRAIPAPQQSMEGVEEPEGLSGDVLVIGFGRFGQIVSQGLLARGHKISTIDTDTDMIRAAATFGMKVYYGDGTRLDILRAAGIENADMVVIAIDKKDQATHIAELIRDEFPLVKVMARAYDRGHAIELVKAGVEYQIREMLDSALSLSAEALRVLGSTDEEVAELIEGVRERDRQRFAAQIVGGIQAGRDLLLSNAEEQARESGAVEGKSEPVMLDKPPEKPTEGAAV